MDELRLIQKTTNVMPLQLVTWFLRFLGVYVHEGDQTEYSSEFLKDIYILDTAVCDMISDGIYIVGDKRNGSSLSEVTEIVYKQGNEKEFLKDFTKALLIENKVYLEKNSKSLLVLYTQGDIEFLADVFVDSKIMQTINLTKYFYKNRRLREYAEQNYRYFLEQLRNYMQMNERTVKNKTFLFVQMYTHYEINCMYKKYGHPIHYDLNSDLKQCLNLLEEIGQNHISLRLLVADILFELKGDTYEAYKNYMDVALNKDVAYAWYKMGCIHSKIGDDPKQCVSYFEKAVKLRPNYYQAWYRAAMCYEQMNRNEAAIKAYKNVIINLDHKWQNRILKPLEVEFIFRSFQRMEKIFSSKGGNPVEAAWAFKNEHQIVKDIEKQTFLDEVLYPGNDLEDIKCVVNDKIRQRLETSLKCNCISPVSIVN